MAGVKGRSGTGNRIPDEVKRARGTLKLSRVNPEQPAIIPARPPTPSGLDEQEAIAYAEWADVLLRIGVLSLQDGVALRELACADVRVVRLRRLVKKHGEVETDPKSGATKQSGYGRAFDSARSDLGRLCAAFGVTPADRARVKAEKKEPPKEQESPRDARRRRILGGGA